MHNVCVCYVYCVVVCVLCVLCCVVCDVCDVRVLSPVQKQFEESLYVTYRLHNTMYARIKCNVCHTSACNVLYVMYA